MTVFEPSEQARAAAGRAVALAEFARRRSLHVPGWLHPTMDLLGELLDTAAALLYEEQPTGADVMAEEVRWVLADAEDTVDEVPHTGFPPKFGQYITYALDDRPLTTLARPDHMPTANDTELAAALDVLHHHLVSAESETVALALLESIFVLHARRASFVQLTQG
ncbi:hypothetical protein [Streptomyces hydrogenans]|uniref:hypothetical protein n=1 Tax=Streptomyces hydrogenans TaxID=1873719 RepID=UPI00344446EB